MEAIDAEDKQDLAAFPFDEEAEFTGLGDALPVGEKGFTTLERRYIIPHRNNNNNYSNNKNNNDSSSNNNSNNAFQHKLGACDGSPCLPS